MNSILDKYAKAKDLRFFPQSVRQFIGLQIARRRNDLASVRRYAEDAEQNLDAAISSFRRQADSSDRPVQ